MTKNEALVARIENMIVEDVIQSLVNKILKYPHE